MRKPLTESQRKLRNFRIAEHRRKLKILAIDYKGGKCVQCGYNKCSRSLDFHHLDPNKKDFAISQSGDTISFARIKLEIDKCILVCKNCHGEIHSKEIENKIQEQKEYIKSVSRYVVNLSSEINCLTCNKVKRIFNSQLRSKNFCSRDCKIKYFYSYGWPEDNEILSMSKELTIPEISGKINKSKSSIYDRLAKLKDGNNNPQVVYRNKINWPTDDELMLMVWQKPRTIIAKEFGVSDNAVIKRCNLRNIKMPGRGYWQKIKSVEHNMAHSSIGRTLDSQSKKIGS